MKKKISLFTLFLFLFTLIPTIPASADIDEEWLEFVDYLNEDGWKEWKEEIEQLGGLEVIKEKLRANSINTDKIRAEDLMTFLSYKRLASKLYGVEVKPSVFDIETGKEYGLNLDLLLKGFLVYGKPHGNLHKVAKVPRHLGYDITGENYPNPDYPVDFGTKRDVEKGIFEFVVEPWEDDKTINHNHYPPVEKKQNDFRKGDQLPKTLNYMKYIPSCNSEMKEIIQAVAKTPGDLANIYRWEEKGLPVPYETFIENYNKNGGKHAPIDENFLLDRVNIVNLPTPFSWGTVVLYRDNKNDNSITYQTYRLPPHVLNTTYMIERHYLLQPDGTLKNIIPPKPSDTSQTHFLNIA